MDECRSSTLDDVMRAVTMENIPFDFGPFLNMSPEGIDMLKGLLQRDPAKRLTARQAINHPWFKLHAAFEEVSKENGLQVHHMARCHVPPTIVLLYIALKRSISVQKQFGLSCKRADMLMLLEGLMDLPWALTCTTRGIFVVQQG